LRAADADLPRNDLLPTMVLQTLAIADLKMPKNMVRKLDEGHIKEVAHGIQAMGFSVPVLVGKGNVICLRTRSTPHTSQMQTAHSVT
jgi:hypothetical protein